MTEKRLEGEQLEEAGLPARWASFLCPGKPFRMKKGRFQQWTLKMNDFRFSPCSGHRHLAVPFRSRESAHSPSLPALLLRGLLREPEDSGQSGSGRLVSQQNKWNLF